MHTLEPYYNWRSFYIASEDVHSPFYEREYSEFEFTHSIYDHAIHPQWDDIGSPTLFVKLIYADYINAVAVIEMIGEWNDCIHNDIMTLKRDFIDHLIDRGIRKFVLIGENVLNFHSSDDSYYEEWFDDVDEGWIAMLNFREHVIQDFQQANIDQYFVCGGKLNEMDWRTLSPEKFCHKIEKYVRKRIGV
ncbi:MAG: hypothetical protein ACPF8V_02875 [Luteibaculum sp.]